MILLTGDIERNDEVELALRYEHELKTTLLIAPHHGSKTSSRYALLGIEAFNTATRGMLTVELNRQGRMSFPRAYRETHRRYWRPIAKRL